MFINNIVWLFRKFLQVNSPGPILTFQITTRIIISSSPIDEVASVLNYHNSDDDDFYRSEIVSMHQGDIIWNPC